MKSVLMNKQFFSFCSLNYSFVIILFSEVLFACVTKQEKAFNYFVAGRPRKLVFVQALSCQGSCLLTF